MMVLGVEPTSRAAQSVTTGVTDSAKNVGGETGMSTLRIMIVDDHPMVREGLKLLLSDETDFDVVGEAADGVMALEVAAQICPDVVLMDVMMPKLNGIEATRHLRQRCPNSQVIVLTSSLGEDLRVQDALKAGAVGYLLKDIQKAELLRAIRSAAEGKTTLHPEAQADLIRQLSEKYPHHDLTERELDVLKLIGQGKSNKKIAVALELTEGTVKGYVSTVLDKLGVADRTQAALYAVEHKLV
jgi:two-component system, NarL family, response regulator LiaR